MIETKHFQFVRTMTLSGYDISIQFPKSYYQDAYHETQHPIVITHDGSYLYEELDTDIIFVGITPNKRSYDYTPWPVEEVEMSGGSEYYLKFIDQVLMPKLHEMIKITPDTPIALAGASYGGLVSLFSLLKRSPWFSHYILISPSMWFPGLIEHLETCDDITEEKQVYWYIGGREGMYHENLMKQMVSANLKSSHIIKQRLTHENSTVQFTFNKEGVHNKDQFKRSFKDALLNLGWL